MLTNFKQIHIGKFIRQRMLECGISVERAAKFLKVSEEEVENVQKKISLDSQLLLCWSKLLEYDFFRIYSQHLILYAPQDTNKALRDRKKTKNTELPVFKKNIYTHEVIMYLIELVESGRKSTRDIQSEYNIPATTILRWINKYGRNIQK